MPYDPATFEEKVALLRAGALAYVASVRTPGASAESLIPAINAWLVSQSNAERTLEVSAVEVVYAGTLTDQKMHYGTTPALDGFGFRVAIAYAEGDVAGMAVYVRVLRQDLEGA